MDTIRAASMKSAHLLQRLHLKHECDEGTAPEPKKTAFGVLISALARVKVAKNRTVGTTRGAMSVYQRVRQVTSHAPLFPRHRLSMVKDTEAASYSINQLRVF